MFAILACLLVSGPPGEPRRTRDATITVDFGRRLVDVPPSRYGAAITGYGRGWNVVTDQTHRGHLRRLRLGTARIELGFTVPGDAESPIVCGGLGCDRTVTGEQWIAGIRALGAEPLVILPMDGRRPGTVDRDCAVDLYRRLARTGTPVRRYLVGNEPDHPKNPARMTVVEYSRRFNMIADALRAVDPGVRVGGPATSYYNRWYITPFLQMSGRRVDFVDFHRYGQGGGTDHPDGALLDDVVRGYGDQLADLRRVIESTVPARARDIEIQVGEFNLDWDGDDRTLDHFNTVWTAAVLGTVLRGGATAIQFGDKNGGLGLTSERGEGDVPRNEPLPSYHGIGMFTGEGLFRPFGAVMVEARSDSRRLHVFASDRGRNVVIVNTGPKAVDTAIRFTDGADRVADRWESVAGQASPRPATPVVVNGGWASLRLPGRSVVTLLVG